MTFDYALDNLKSRQIPTDWLVKVKHGFKCYNCGKGFSFIDIAAFHYNLDISNFADTVRKICEFELQNLIVDDVENAKKNVAKLPEFEKRGLNDETLKTFQIGVDFKWTP